MKAIISVLCLFYCTIFFAQDYYYQSFAPFDDAIPSPEEFLGYPIGEHHTRHDLMVAYFSELAELSDQASLVKYGETFGKRQLVLLQIATEENLAKQEEIRQAHLNHIFSTNNTAQANNLPIIINLGYNVHGNEPSGGEAALLAAYVLVASQHPDIVRYRNESMTFVDPAINPDGRDRHSHWVNMFKGSPLVADPDDVEHNEAWPRGRTNHYWFDLNRDWLLGINPESRGKLNWYHQWYPNVVTDFHEMGTNSTYFFEPMKTNGSKDPIMPKDNYITLNDLFAEEFSSDLDAIGSLYFTKEVFDGTYPGYGSSYPDLQGGLGLLFEQASSRGHVQDRPSGKITFPFTIRNQFISSISTVKAAVNNREYLQKYQQQFFSGAKSKAKNISGYVFGDPHDVSRTNAFIDKLLLHRVDVYPLSDDMTIDGVHYGKESSYYVPTGQHQYRMVQTCFETYDEFQDSVFYDASAWSLAHFYNMSFSSTNRNTNVSSQKLTQTDIVKQVPEAFAKSNVAYLSTWDEYNTPAFLYELLDNNVKVNVSQKPFTIASNNSNKSFSYGSLIIPVASQDLSADELYKVLSKSANTFGIQLHSANSGFSISGIDLGSRFIDPVTKPKALMITHGSTSGYEAGEVWHLLDQRIGMPITKIPEHQFNRVRLSDYNTLILVSGRYSGIDSTQIQKIKSWISDGNTLIAQRTAVQWAVKNKLVDAEMHKSESEEDEPSSRAKAIRKLYINASEELGKSRIGGMILKTELDLTHPIAYGYHKSELPVYRNSTVFIKPSENEYANVSLYSSDPHIDGFITKENLEKNVVPSASIVVSEVGRGRAILFADNPNFRGSWYGTNKLFLNAIFFGDKIRVPD